MPEETSVGTIYFDLALKDTINAQLQAAAARTKAQVQHAFDGVGDQIQKSISATGTQAAQPPVPPGARAWRWRRSA
mgnify:CR=1 FL=1